jgi:uncharacterized protein YjbI with pentapeptide repeats
VPPHKIPAPKITAPKLTDLTPADAEEIRSGGDADGLRVADADLSDLQLGAVTWIESEIIDATMRSTRLERCRFLDVRLERLNAIDLTAPSSKWRDSEILASRLGSVNMYDATIDSLRIAGSKIGYLNLRGSVINDLVLDDCPIEELDLTDASVTRAQFAGCVIETLTIRNATFKHVDLRGARIGRVDSVANLAGTIIDNSQLIEFAPLLSDGLGITIG